MAKYARVPKGTTQILFTKQMEVVMNSGRVIELGAAVYANASGAISFVPVPSGAPQPKALVPLSWLRNLAETLNLPVVMVAVDSYEVHNEGDDSAKRSVKKS